VRWSVCALSQCFLPAGQQVCKAGLDPNKHTKYPEIDRASGVERDPEQSHYELTKVRPHSRVFYSEFAIVEKFLQVRELIPALPNLRPQVLLLGNWRNVLYSLFDFGAELISMKH
jgi:hypothetical protein